MTDYTLQDIEIIRKRGWERICKKCRFVIPEHEFRVFKECGQCGSKAFVKEKVGKNFMKDFKGVYGV
jgi:rRNA maturation endonuclease Nob1